MRNRGHGFSIIEIVMGLGVIAIIAFALSPILFKYINDARLVRTDKEARLIAQAINNLAQDLGDPPGWTSGASRTASSAFVDLLVSPGSVPATDGTSATAGWAIGSRTQNTDAGWENLANHLVTNTPGGNASLAYPTSGRFSWMGPYLSEVTEDPWGNAYLVNIRFAKPGAAANAVFVISAGPDQKISTAYTQPRSGATVSLGGDDIGARIR